MPRRPTRSKNLWPSPTRIFGYVLNRNGVAVLRYHRQWKSTGLAFCEDNKATCLEMLEEWIRSGMTSTGAKQIVEQIRDETAPRTVRRAWSVINEEMKTTESKPVQKIFKQAMNTYFPAGKDCRLDVDACAQQIRRIDREIVALKAKGSDGGLDVTTRVKRLRTVRRFFDEAMRRKWIDRNPFDFVEIPRARKDRAAVVFTDDEIRRIDKWFEKKHREAHAEGKTKKGLKHDNDTYDRYRLLWRFLHLTGCRIAEAIDLEWKDVSDDVIIFDAKRERSDEEKLHGFPAAAFPEVGELMEEIRAAGETADPLKRRFVFPWWRQTGSPQAMLKECLDELGIRGKSVKTWRATAGQRLLDMGFSDDLISDIIGHSEAVRRLHYRPKQRAGDVKKRIDQERRRALASTSE